MQQILPADLVNCDREPIHIPGFIQSHGFLVAIVPESGMINRVSANVESFLGVPPGALLGQQIARLDEFIQWERQPANISKIVELGMLTENLEQLNPQPVLVNKKEMYLLVHSWKGSLMLEFEPRAAGEENLNLQRIMNSSLSVIQTATDFPRLITQVASLIKEITGYTRIMIYRFHKDHHGEVIAEAKEPELESWLHLHYPASDIPAQARELYKLNLVRLIADVHSSPAGLLADADSSKPLDLTHSTLRAVSPVHIEYLKNMQVGASFSISLINRGELWGLIACHHENAKFIDYPARSACKFIGQLFSAALEFKNTEQLDEKNTAFKDNQIELFSQLLKEPDPVVALLNMNKNLLDISDATGVVFVYEGQRHTLGKLPGEEEVGEIVSWIRREQPGSFYQTTQLPIEFEAAKKYASSASGLLAIEISHDWNEYIIWFKPEVIHTVDWAGDQQKNISEEKDGSIRISPRKSFAKWTQEVRYTAEEWSNSEIAAALKLREDLIQVINKKASEIRKLNELLKEAYDELDTFSFTISHDLRTPLSSIKNYSEIILEDHGGEMSNEARALFDRVIKGTDKMAGLIKDVLQYSRVGRASIRHQPIDMGRLLREIRDELLAPISGRNIEFFIDETPSVLGDKTMMMQLFTNLAGNAVKYSTPVPKAVVRIGGRIENDFVVYTVSDNGIGIDMKYATRIFELFKRLDNVRQIEGTGVGLAIAKRIVEKHDGKIWLESKLNSGTKFYIAIPLNPRENAQEDFIYRR